MSRNFFPLVVAFFSFLIFSGCGYRFGGGSIAYHYRTICVPYVDGDRNGILTDCLINALMTQGRLLYRSTHAELILQVSLLQPEEKTIGFAYAPKESGANTHVIVSNEARLTLIAEFSVIDRRLGTPVFGPIVVNSSLDYDYEPDLTKTDENEFSLGQLEMHNPAQETARSALYKLLAEKIVDYLKNY